MNEEMRKEIILDNYQEPFHKGLVEDDSYYRANSKSDSCIDNLDFMIKIENGVVEDIRFDGEACAISISASSLLIQSLIGKTVDEAKNLIVQYKKMIDHEEYDDKLLGELNVYCEIYKQPNRKNCALIPVFALNKLLARLENYQ